MRESWGWDRSERTWCTSSASMLKASGRSSSVTRLLPTRVSSLHSTSSSPRKPAAPHHLCSTAFLFKHVKAAYHLRILEGI